MTQADELLLCREAFEKWRGVGSAWLIRNGEGYQYAAVDNMWENFKAGWQARTPHPDTAAVKAAVEALEYTLEANNSLTVENGINRALEALRAILGEKNEQ